MLTLVPLQKWLFSGEIEEGSDDGSAVRLIFVLLCVMWLLSLTAYRFVSSLVVLKIWGSAYLMVFLFLFFNVQWAFCICKHTVFTKCTVQLLLIQIQVCFYFISLESPSTYLKLSLNSQMLCQYFNISSLVFPSVSCFGLFHCCAFQFANIFSDTI